MSRQNKHHMRKKSMKGQAPKVTLTFEQFAEKMSGKMTTMIGADKALQKWADEIGHMKSAGVIGESQGVTQPMSQHRREGF